MNSIFNNRLDKVYHKIHELKYDGLYITNLTNIRYLTGFTGSAAILFILNNKSYFLTDGRYIQQSKEQVQNATVHILTSNYFDLIKQTKILTNEAFNIGFESNHMSFSYYTQLSKNFPNIDHPIVDILKSIED